MNLEVVTEYKEFEKLRQEWNITVQTSGNDRIYFTHEWFSAWWGAFGYDSSIFILLVKEGNEVVGIAPLRRCKDTFRGLPVRSIKFISNNDSPGCGLIIKNNKEAVAEHILLFLLNNLKAWDVMLFENIVLDEVSINIAEIVKRSKLKYLVKEGLSSPCLHTTGDWEEYYKNLSSKSKKTIRNIRNRIKREENIIVNRFGDSESLNDLALVSKKGWKYKEGKSFINKDERKLFFKLLSKEAQANKWLSIWCMYKGDMPIAYEYHLQYKNEDVALLAEFDNDYRKYSPGAYLDYKIIKSLFDGETKEYDMCGTTDEYKRKWAGNLRQHQNITIFNGSIYSKSLYFFETKAVKLLRKSRDLLAQ